MFATSLVEPQLTKCYHSCNKLSDQRQEKEQKDKVAQQAAQDMLKAKKEADRIFSAKQQLKAQRAREDEKKLQDFHATQMVW